MRFVPQLLATAAVAIIGTFADTDSPPKFQYGTQFGGPHGTEFSDEDVLNKAFYYGLKSITLEASGRLVGITMVYNEYGTRYHGSIGVDQHTLELQKGEYFNMVEWYQDKHHGHTRVFYLKITTNKGNSIEAGEKSGTHGQETAPKEYALHGFKGREGDNVDLLQVIWMRDYNAFYT
ncbi:hypothetical protein PsorP6_019179 [Peronosclerospora sorghi]|nr:hypothetical protein PsorP6_019179 [Peronosclerospora sorghi]